MTRAKLSLFSLLLTLFQLVRLTGIASGFGDPRGFLSNETVTETVLNPGVVYYQVTGFQGSSRQVAHVVAVDISEPHLTMKALPGQRLVTASSGQFFRRSTVSQLQADNDALVAINTAFFDIGSTMAPTGLLMQNKNLLREPASNRTTFLFSDDGLPIIGNFGFSGTLRYGSTSRSFAGINRHVLSNGQVNVYQQPWDRSPGTSAALTNGLQITEVLVEKTGFLPSPAPGTPARMQGRVLQIRENQPSVAIGQNRFVITAAGSARAFLQQMSINSTVEVEWRLTGGPAGLNWNSIAHASPGSNLLVSNGTRLSQNTDHWNSRHPRSAIGISQDSSQLVLLMVEGRQSGRAEGMSLHRIGQYLQHMGAHNGLEFDGGGSSSIAAQVDGANTRLNTPSDASERNVPAGLGVHVVEEPVHPLFRDISVSSSGRDAVITWTTRAPAISYARYGQARLNRYSARKPQLQTRHSAILSDLSSGTNYARLVAEVPGASTEVSQLVAILPEIIMDDPEAVLTGSPAWGSGTWGNPWGGSHRSATTVTGSSTYTATYTPSIQIPGMYDVYVWFVHGTNRTTDARYQIFHAGGLRQTSVNQTLASNGERWLRIASNLRFTREGNHSVRIINQSSQGGAIVIADGVRWVLTNPDPAPPGSAPLWWTRHFFGETEPDFATDTDGDGMSVHEEYIWGTDPTDPESRPRHRLAENDSEQLGIVFSPYHEGRNYRLEGRTSLTDGNWINIAASSPVRLETGEGFMPLPNVSGMEKAFFRVVVEKP